ncbi:MAG: hypothetical protein E5X58_13210 [Mesorhizobium sp.]|nr:MAG: hypothetical protein E5X58_13210 [Mesorhizobium sp.]
MVERRLELLLAEQLLPVDPCSDPAELDDAFLRQEGGARIHEVSQIVDVDDRLRLAQELGQQVVQQAHDALPSVCFPTDVDRLASATPHRQPSYRFKSAHRLSSLPTDSKVV